MKSMINLIVFDFGNTKTFASSKNLANWHACLNIQNSVYTSYKKEISPTKVISTCLCLLYLYGMGVLSKEKNSFHQTIKVLFSNFFIKPLIKNRVLNSNYAIFYKTIFQSCLGFLFQSIL